MSWLVIIDGLPGFLVRLSLNMGGGGTGAGDFNLASYVCMPAVFDDLSDEIQKSLKYEMKMCWAPLQSWPDITLQNCSKNIRTGRTFIIYMFTFLAELVNSDTDTASPARLLR